MGGYTLIIKMVKIYGFSWSQDILRLLCYTGAGIIGWNAKFWIGIPLFLILMYLGGKIEELNTIIIQKPRRRIIKWKH